MRFSVHLAVIERPPLAQGSDHTHRFIPYASFRIRITWMTGSWCPYRVTTPTRYRTWVDIANVGNYRTDVIGHTTPSWYWGMSPQLVLVSVTVMVKFLLETCCSSIFLLPLRSVVEPAVYSLSSHKKSWSFSHQRTHFWIVSNLTVAKSSSASVRT